MDPLTEAYMSVIEEKKAPDNTVKTTKKQVGKPFGDKELTKQDDSTNKSRAAKPKNAPANLTAKGSTGNAKALKNMKNPKESTNPFDLIYNKILNEEESFNFSTDDNSLEMEPNSSFEDDTDSEFDDDTTEDSSEEVTITLDKEVASKLIEVLQAAIGETEGEEEGEEESDEFGEEEGEGETEGEEGGSDEDQYEESVEAEELGHALVDSEKLSKGLTGKNNVVTGAVPVTKKSAQVPSTGKGSDGKLTQHSTDSGVSKLTNKKNDVGAVKVGKTLFDND
jgi:hypothetical protein